MSTLTTTDPGPMQRFKTVIAKADTMSVIVQRLTDGETLKEIAAAWQIPYGKLAEWVIEDRERSDAYNQALKIWSDSLAQETVGIADSAAEEAAAVQKAKLQIDTRLKLAGKLNRERYGESQEVHHTGGVSLIAVLSSLPRGKTIEAEDAQVIEAQKKIPEKISTREENVI